MKRFSMPLLSLSFILAGSWAAHAEDKAPVPTAPAPATPAVSSAPSTSAGGNIQIAVINIQEIMHESLAAKSIKEQLEKKQKSFQAELSAKEETLQKESQGLAKERAVLSKEAMDQKIKEFDTKAKEAQKGVQTKRAQLDKAFGNSIGEIQKEVNRILTDMAKERGFIVALPAQQILYNDAKLDITKEVLARLNKSLPKVTLNF